MPHLLVTASNPSSMVGSISAGAKSSSGGQSSPVAGASSKTVPVAVPENPQPPPPVNVYVPSVSAPARTKLAPHLVHGMSFKTPAKLTVAVNPTCRHPHIATQGSQQSVGAAPPNGSAGVA